MKESLFTDIVLSNDWTKMSDGECAKILQQFEHENSAFQKAFNH